MAHSHWRLHLFNIKSAVSSTIKLEVLGADGQARRTLEFKNIMTSTGLSSWTRGALGSHIAFGSGSRTESESVTDLAGFVTTSAGTYSYANANFIDEAAAVMRTDSVLLVLLPPEVSAKNYSEMGIHNNNVNALQTYARIRDAGGAPTSVGVQVGERLRVSYVVQYSIPLQSAATQSIGGVPTLVTTVPYQSSINVDIRLPDTSMYSTYFWPAGQPIPSAGLLPVGGVRAPQDASLTNGLYSFTAQLTQLNLAGGISLMKLGGGNSVSVMFHFDPPISKTALNTMNINLSASLTNGVFYA